MMDAAITQSMQQSNAATSTEDKAVEGDFEDSNPLMSAIKSLRKNVDEDDTMRIEVRREFLLKDALREAHKKKFSPCRNMKVIVIVMLISTKLAESSVVLFCLNVFSCVFFLLKSFIFFLL